MSKQLQEKFHQVKVLILDFDNCLILDEKTRKGSEELKDESWSKVFSEYAPSLVNFLYERAKRDVKGGTGDRLDVFERVCRGLGIPESEITKEVVRRSEHFETLVQEGIKKIGISKKARNTLFLISKNFPIYMNTATPLEFVLKSLDTLSVTSLFKGVYGRPRTKLENMRVIIAAESVNPGEVLFIDDQESGWAISQEVRCIFVGIHTARNRSWHNGDQIFPVIHSINELTKLLTVS